jgi:hypothetical protein
MVTTQRSDRFCDLTNTYSNLRSATINPLHCALTHTAATQPPKYKTFLQGLVARINPFPPKTLGNRCNRYPIHAPAGSPIPPTDVFSDGHRGIAPFTCGLLRAGFTEA